MCGLDNIKANKMQTVSRVHVFEQLQKTKQKHITEKLCALCWWSWLVTMTAERRPCIYLAPSYKLADTHLQSQTVAEKLPCKAMTCSTGAVWVSTSHSRTLHHAVRRQQAINPDSWWTSSTFWATVINTQAADWLWRHTVWLLNELCKKNVTLYWKTIFSCIVFVFCFLGIVGIL